MCKKMPNAAYKVVMHGHEKYLILALSLLKDFAAVFLTLIMNTREFKSRYFVL